MLMLQAKRYPLESRGAGDAPFALSCQLPLVHIMPRQHIKEKCGRSASAHRKEASRMTQDITIRQDGRFIKRHHSRVF